MNKNNAKDYLPLVQALAEGKVVQVKGIDGWKELPNYDFTRSADNYRIKPEPREVYIVYNPEGSRISMWTTEQYAVDASQPAGYTYAKFREVE